MATFALQNAAANLVSRLTTLGASTTCCSVESIQCTSDGRFERILRLSSPMVQTNQVVLKIPFRCCLTPNTFDSLIHPHMSKKQQEELQGMLHSRKNLKKQILHLLHASTAAATAATSTLHSEYIATLPGADDFAHLPSNWSQARVDAFGPLVSQMLQSFINRFDGEIQSLYEELVPVVKHLVETCPDLFPVECIECIAEEDGIFSINFVKWSMCNTNSRCFDLNAYNTEVQEQDSAYLPGLVPFIDLCNHSFEASLAISVERDDESIGDGDNRVIVARATRDLTQGDELTLNYHGNGQEVIHYLFYYGFVPDKNVQHIVYYHTTFDLTNTTTTITTLPNNNDDDDDDRETDRAQYADTLLDALQIMGLPRTDQFALPAVIEDPLPAAWIYLLRFQELWKEGKKTGDFTLLCDVAQGKRLRLKAEHEETARRRLSESVESSLAWYLTASDALECRRAASTMDPDDQLLSKMFAVALEVLKKTLEKCVANEF